MAVPAAFVFVFVLYICILYLYSIFVFVCSFQNRFLHVSGSLYLPQPVAAVQPAAATEQPQISTNRRPLLVHWLTSFKRGNSSYAPWDTFDWLGPELGLCNRLTLSVIDFWMLLRTWGQQSEVWNSFQNLCRYLSLSVLHIPLQLHVLGLFEDWSTAVEDVFDHFWCTALQPSKVSIFSRWERRACLVSGEHLCPPSSCKADRLWTSKWLQNCNYLGLGSSSWIVQYDTDI